MDLFCGWILGDFHFRLLNSYFIQYFNLNIPFTLFSDSQPCIGTCGAIQWHLKATGKLFHSGLPHLGVNALELGMEALKIVQDRFYKDFPPHAKEAGEYKKFN
jgi:hypothetical protein